MERPYHAQIWDYPPQVCSNMDIIDVNTRWLLSPTSCNISCSYDSNPLTHTRDIHLLSFQLVWWQKRPLYNVYMACMDRIDTELTQSE